MIDIERRAISTEDYSLYKPEVSTGQTIVFYPGMACNRFGHPDAKEPVHAVADLVALAADRYNILFPEVHESNMESDGAPIVGRTIEAQNQKLSEILREVGREIGFGRITYIGQSLGCLAVAQLAALGGAAAALGRVAGTERAIFWGPPTLEGEEHKDMLVSKFIHKPETRIDKAGNGQLQLGNDSLMYVSSEYWRSLDENSLRVHNDAMALRYESTVAICATQDNFYPKNKEYLATYVPAVSRIEIEGTHHLFRPRPMREELKRFMHRLL